jgi:endonuclease/exonuclease/phosphatase family metal-dependent hydrolase
MHPFSSAGEKTKTQLKVMSFNAGAFYFLYKKNPEKIARPFFEFLKKENPDIACFQEFTYKGTNFENRMDSLRTWAGFKYFKGSENKQILIASKYPFENSGYLKFKRTHNGAVFADVQWNGKTFRVYNLHLESNQITPQAEKLAESGDLQEKETWLEIGSILKKNKEASKKRAIQAEEISNHMKKSPYPILVCGDFNDTPSSYVYGILSEGLNDGFRQSGFGIGTTYAGRIPALRIDYILSGLDMDFKKSRVHRMGFSDHYPVTATLETKKD